jgi:hypothetical protein
MAVDRSPEFDAGTREWCAKVATLSVDVLVARVDFELARSMVAEEVFVRPCLRDYPPAIEEPPGQY